MPDVVISLTDDEYVLLAEEAAQDIRTPEQQAKWLILQMLTAPPLIIEEPSIVTCGRRAIEDFSPHQFAVIKILYDNVGTVVKREAIADAIHGGVDGVSEAALDAVIRRVRERLRSIGADRRIETVRNVGWRLNQ